MRLLTQSDYNGTSGYLGAGMTYSRAVVYNDKNQIVSDDTSVHRSDDRYRTLSTYDYGEIVLNADGSVNVAASDYALGSALQVDAKGWKNDVDGNEPDRRTVNTYHWYDGAVAAAIAHTPSLSNPGTVWTTTYAYDPVGGQALLERASIQDGRPRMVAWTNDMLGQVIRRSEKDNQTGGDPHEIWHRFSGRQMGYVGNNGNYDVTYYTSRALRQSPGGPSSFADFDLAHDHINSYEQGSHGGVYTVQSGDTLEGIAAGLWGDASLWYKIAEVNGLTASSTLIEGQPLLIPVGVQRNENNAATYQPYDPLEVLGNTSPTSPKPKQNACGTGGQVLLVIIAVVVTVVMAAYLGVEGAITSGKIWAAVIGGATAGAAGSVASQGVGVATGIQEKFSWNAVALSAIGGGVGAGVGAAASALSSSTTSFGSALLSNSFVQGALGSAITQGVGYATGLQDKFSWAGVAAAGVGAFVGSQIGGEGFDAKFMRSGARAIANAATRSLMNGGDFGDNLMAALPDVIGQTIGEAIAVELAGAGDPVKAQGDGDSNADMTADGWRMDSDGRRYRIGLPADDHGYSNAAPERRSWWDQLWGGVGDFFSDFGDTLGITDGRIGFNHTRENREQAYLDSLRWPVVDSDEIVVEGGWVPTPDGQGYVPYNHYGDGRRWENQRPARPPRFIDVPRTIFRGTNDSIQSGITQPSTSFGRWAGLAFSDPRAAARQMGGFFRDTSDGIEHVARTDVRAVADGVVDGYTGSYERDGLAGVANRAAYQAGYLAPLAAGGPYTAEARLGLGADDLLFALRPRAIATAGETTATAIGRSAHARFAAERLAEGTFDIVNAPIVGSDGQAILVPRRIDLATGTPIAELGLQTARPDAVRFLEGVIIDDKPLGRAISRDRQEIIRFIRAYEQSRGVLPNRVAIQRYDPLTGQPVRTDLYSPDDFLPP